MFGQALLLKQDKSSTNLPPSATTEINISRSVLSSSKELVQAVGAWSHGLLGFQACILCLSPVATTPQNTKKNNLEVVSATGLDQWTSLVSPCFKESVVSVTESVIVQGKKVWLVRVTAEQDWIGGPSIRSAVSSSAKPQIYDFVDKPLHTKDFDPSLFQACGEGK